MDNMDNPNSWDKIQTSVQETERLLSQKKYNLAMIKACQITEYMIKLHCDKAGIVQDTPENMVRELYSAKSLSKSTAERYLQILAIGNKATTEGDKSPVNANQAYHLLSQEVYAFANHKEERTRRSGSKASSPSSRGAASRKTASRQSDSSNNNRSRKRQSGLDLHPTDLLKLLIPLALIIVLIILIRVLAPSEDPTDETTTVPPTTTETLAETTTTVPTETETESIVYKTTTTLNVRSGPSTDAERIGKLDPGAEVTYVRDKDDTWAVILYNGQEAYVSKEYLTTE